MPDSEDLPSSFSSGRRWLYWLNNLLAAIAVLALVVMVNYLAEDHYKRFEMDRDSAFKLSPQTVRVLDSLTNDVNITIFFEPHGANEAVYELTAGLLAEYQAACPRHIHLHPLDYDREVGEAKEFLIKYNLTGLKEKDFIFFECGGATKSVDAKQLSDYDLSGLMQGRTKYVRRNAFLGELYFTTSIYDVSNPRPMKAYFLYGHGEDDPADNDTLTGYGKFAGVLKNEANCDWQKLTLQGTNTIPADCQLLIVPASAHEGRLLPEELNKISSYLKDGGRMFALLRGKSGLEFVLTNWGVLVGDNRVTDLDKNLLLQDGTFLTEHLAGHPIMNPLAVENRRLLMIAPRPVDKIENQAKTPGAPEVTLLAETSLHAIDNEKHIGVFPLMVAVEQGGIQGVNSPGGRGTRMVVVGDSFFLGNQIIGAVDENHFFAELALNWLLQRPQTTLVGLEPHPIKEYKLYMTEAQNQEVRWLFLAGMPGGVLFLGGLVWLRRRR